MAAAVGADFLGLVGPMPSGPGILTLAEARAVAQALPDDARPILLTAAETAQDIAREAAFVGVEAVQVVRPLTGREARALSGQGLHYLQVIHVEGPDALDLIDLYAEHCDAFLLDSGRPSQGQFGGTGRVHDWTLSAAFCDRAPRPVYLAGGLTPETVGAAIRQVRPAGVDICSGLRRNGALDPALLDTFMAAIDASGDFAG